MFCALPTAILKSKDMVKYIGVLDRPPCAGAEQPRWCSLVWCRAAWLQPDQALIMSWEIPVLAPHAMNGDVVLVQLHQAPHAAPMWSSVRIVWNMNNDLFKQTKPPIALVMIFVEKRPNLTSTYCNVCLAKRLNRFASMHFQQGEGTSRGLL